MRILISLTSLLLSVAVAASAPNKSAGPNSLSDEIIALERAALNRWITADPQGYLDLYSSEITYFDPLQEKRVDGLEAMKALLAPLKNARSPITNRRFEMIVPKIQQHGDVVLLTFNLVNYGKLPNQATETVVTRWNSTEVYSRASGQWRIIHSHWSFVKPELKQNKTTGE